jgi:hypothetical protein
VTQTKQPPGNPGRFRQIVWYQIRQAISARASGTGKGTPAALILFGFKNALKSAQPMPHHPDDGAFLKRAAGQIRSIAEREPGLADELAEIATDLEAEADRQILADLRRRDFTLSTRSLSARIAARP